MKIYRVDPFLLKDEYKPKGEIFFVVRGGDTEKEHKAYAEGQKDLLLEEHDDTYTSWVYCEVIFNDSGKIDPYVSVLGFRVRDVY